MFCVYFDTHKSMVYTVTHVYMDDNIFLKELVYFIKHKITY